MDKDLLLEKIQELASERNQTLTDIFLKSGVGKNFKSNLNYAKPSLGKITMLANYLNVSVDYLLGKSDEKEKPIEDDGLTDLEREILEKIDALPPEKLEETKKFIDYLLATQEKE